FKDPYSSGTYDIEVIIEKENDKFFLQYYMCTCEKELYSNICDHTTAFILYIMNTYKISKVKQEKVNAFSREQRLQNDLINFLNVESDITDVRLIPHFVIKKNNVFLKLKIGLEKLYSIQNVSEFLERVSEMNYFSYGKELEFTHTIDCFEDKAVKLIDLLDVADLYTETKNKELKLVPKLLYNILILFKNEEISFTLNNEEYTVINNLEERTISISANEQFITLEKLDLLHYLKSINGLVGLDCKSTYLYSLNKHELKLFSMLENNSPLPINLVKDEFMTNIYPKVKNIVNIDDKLKNLYPDVELKIESYFDLIDSVLILQSKYYEEGIKKELNNISSLNKNVIKKYLSILENFNIKNNKITDVDQIVAFTEADLTPIKNFGAIFLSNNLKNLSVNNSPKVILKANYKVNLIELNVESQYTSNELERIIKAYKRKASYVQLKDDVIVRIDDDVQNIVDMIDDFDLDYKNLKDATSKPESFIMKFVNDDDVVVDEKIQDVINELKNYKDAKYELPVNLKNILRSYQYEAFNWLKIVSKYNFGAVLADDMGLGKTLEMLSLISSDKIDKPSLIVAPTSLIYNWYSECVKWCPNINVKAINGTSTQRKNIITALTNSKTIYITSYDSLIRDIEYYTNEFRFLIIDEAQYIKNHTTRKAKVTKSLKSEIKFALTGTPVENSLADLWSIFDFIMPGYLSSYNTFKDRYERLIMSSDKESLELLKSKITPFILRRTKKQVLKDLPDKIEEVYYAELTGEQEKLYHAYINQIKIASQQKTKVEILSMITRLRQICVAPSMFLEDYNSEEAKIDLTIELVNKAIFGNHKILIFSQFTKALDILKDKLDELDISNLILTGDTKSKERLDLVNEFNNQDDIKVFLISLKAGGTGLNLVSADTVIHLDPWWNLSAEAQATDRAHRMGQKNTVNVIKIVCAKTIEERVLLLQDKKSKLANSIIDNDEANFSVQPDDLSFLLS
ncbi:MAG: DEAD/DEAH box helicase, partial [bacterium]